MGWINSYIVPFIVPLLTIIISVIQIFLSEPKNKKVAWICAVLLVATSTSKEIQEYFSKESTKQASIGVSRDIYNKTALHTHRFVDQIKTMMIYAAGDWLPQNQEEFFSRKGIDLVCNELDAEKTAPVAFTKINWYQRFSQVAAEYKKELNELMKSYGSQISPTLHQKIAAVEDSATLSFLGHLGSLYRARQQNMVKEAPPLLCYSPKEELEKFFLALSELVDEIKKEGSKLDVERAKNWVEFSPPGDVPYRGSHRFGPEAIAKWCAEHPGRCTQKQGQ